MAKTDPTAAWWAFKVRVELTRGKTGAAGRSLTLARTQFSTDLGLQLLAHDFFHRTGQNP